MSYHLIGFDTASVAGPLEAKLRAARDAGFSHVMISATDIVNHPAGIDAAVRCVRESGLRITGFEALRDYEGLSGKMHEYKIDVAKSMLEMCARIGGRLLIVHASTSLHADPEPAKVARDLAKLAFLALPLGIRVAIKGFPRSRTVGSLTEADEILSRAACSNLGVVIDAFDVIAAGIPLTDLDIILPDQVFLVQISDFMLHQIRSAEEYGSTEHHFRVFPGEGAHSDALVELIAKMEEVGFTGDYSFDVYNSDYLEMPPGVIAARGRQAADWLGETVLRRTLPVPNMERLRQTRKA